MRILTIAAAIMLMAPPAIAEDAPRLRIKDHRFQPERIEVPTGVKFKLMVKNDDKTVEEFESFELNREKIVPAGKEIPVFLGPLQPGEYPFFCQVWGHSKKGMKGTLVVQR